jgi:hypothetical protein
VRVRAKTRHGSRVAKTFGRSVPVQCQEFSGSLISNIFVKFPVNRIF